MDNSTLVKAVVATLAVVVLGQAGVALSSRMWLSREPRHQVNTATEAVVHLRKACEVVWTNADEYQIDRCVMRAMAAMGNDNRLRDNELKRLLLSSEQELERCKEELAKIREGER